MDLDNNLARLVAISVPDLSVIDGAMLATRAHVEALQSRRALGAAMVVALGIGVVGIVETPPVSPTTSVAVH